MKHKFLHLNGFIALSLCLIMPITIFSCSDDDNDGPEMPKVKMGLTSMEGGYLNYQELNGLKFSNVEYDSDGRVVSYTHNGTSYTPIHFTYEYSQDKITVKSRYDNDSEASIDRVYNLKNGIIISESESSIVYNYNEQNQLNSCSGQYETYNFTWNNGNPVSVIIKEGAYKYSNNFEFTSDANTLSCFQQNSYSVVYFDLCDPFLMAAGYFGQQPKNLLKSISDEDGDYHKFSYSDFNENGYPCTMQVSDEDGDIQEYTFKWTKI